MIDWQTDKAWADGYWSNIEHIIRRVAGKIIEVKPTSIIDDQKFARDYIVASGCIACRIRRLNCAYRDLTIRCSRPMSGNHTELQKIIDGHVRWMLYGWTKNESLSEWVFVDALKIVNKGLHLNRKKIRNHDNSSEFIAIGLSELLRIGAIVDSQISVPTEIHGGRRRIG